MSASPCRTAPRTLGHAKLSEPNGVDVSRSSEPLPPASGALADDRAPSPRVLGILALGAVTMVLDGFDNQLLGFAVTQIVNDFGATRADFAWVFAVGFVGVGLGTATGGLVGDRVGRKLGLIFAVTVFGVFTALSSVTGTTVLFGVCRLLAGLGLGMALPSVATLVTEFAPARWRNLAIAVTVACVPGGALLGGIVAAVVLPRTGWRELYLLGGIAPLLLTIVLAVVLLESPQFLAVRGRPGDQARRADILRLTGGPVDPPANPARAQVGGPRELLGRTLRRDTLGLWGAFFFSTLGVFSFFSWGPSLLQANGYSLASASLSITLYNVGGIVVAVVGGLLVNRFGSRPVLVTMAAGAALSAAWLLLAPPHNGNVGLMYTAQILIHGGCFAGLQTVLYNLASQLYPVSVRATGVGLAGTVGRAGAITAALAAGGLVAVGGHSFMILLLVSGALAAVCLLAIGHHLPARRLRAVGPVEPVPARES